MSYYFNYIAPLGTTDWRGASETLKKFKVTAVIPHINTIEPLKVCVEVLRAQTEKPYIVIVDTGSPPEVVEQLQQMRADDLEIHFQQCHAYTNSSEAVTIALDIAHAVCQTPYIFHTHSDCFL